MTDNRGESVQTQELIEHVRELQRKASAYDELVEELGHVQRHFESLSRSLAHESKAFEGTNSDIMHEWSGKSRGFLIAASKLRDILSDEGQGKA